MPGAFGAGDEVALKAAAVAEPGTDGVDLVATVTCAEPYTVAARPGGEHGASWPTTSASSARSCATCRAWARSPSCPRPRPPTRCWPASPTACSCPTAPATRRRWPAPPRPSRAWSTGCRCSASASATSCWRPRSAPPRTSCRSATTAATTPCAAWPRAGSRSPARTTTTRWPRGRSAPTSTVTHVNLNDGVIEGIRADVAAGLQRAVPPRGRPGPHDAAYLFDEFAALIDASRRGP